MCEMIKIMQEYGEVTCCLGSSANLRNSCLFLQSDIRSGAPPLPPGGPGLGFRGAGAYRMADLALVEGTEGPGPGGEKREQAHAPCCGRWGLSKCS